jgi:uncharacterized membrane protein
MPGARAPFPWRVLITLALCPLLVQFALISDLWLRIASGLGLARLLRISVVAASAVPHTLIYLALLVIFGITLRPGRDAIITALARRMYGVIPQDMVVYTRRVTWVWCGYFVGQLATSLFLFFAAPLVVWSFFVNVLNLPLFAALFITEQSLRPFFLHDAPRHSAADVLRMIGLIKESAWRRTSR